MTQWGFDRVIVSSDENPLYIEFWPFIAAAYKAVFPSVVPTLVLLSRRDLNDPFIQQLEKHGEVLVFEPVEGFTRMAQTKMLRYYVATRFIGNEVIMIDDIDEIPISREWHTEKFLARQKDSMLFVGSETYFGDGGQCPASMMTAEAPVFAKLFGNDMTEKMHSFASWMEYMKTYRVEGKSHVNITNDHEKDDPIFSDEALIVELRKKNPVPATHVRRGYEVGVTTIDRSYLHIYSKEKLMNGVYVAAHTGRPFAKYKELTRDILFHIQERYQGKLTTIEELTPPVDGYCK